MFSNDDDFLNRFEGWRGAGPQRLPRSAQPQPPTGLSQKRWHTRRLPRARGPLRTQRRPKGQGLQRGEGTPVREVKLQVLLDRSGLVGTPVCPVPFRLPQTPIRWGSASGGEHLLGQS